MIAANVGDDRLVHLVAAHPNGAAIDDAAERKDGYLDRPAGVLPEGAAVRRPAR